MFINDTEIRYRYTTNLFFTPYSVTKPHLHTLCSQTRTVIIALAHFNLTISSREGCRCKTGALTKIQRSINSFTSANMNDYQGEATCGCFNLLAHSTARVRLSLELCLASETPLKLS